MSESHKTQKPKSFGERLDSLEQQVWKLRWGLYVLAGITASPKLGGPSASDVVQGVVTWVGAYL